MNGHRQLLADLGILVARLGTGLVLLAYGWQKLMDWGISGTVEIMAGGGVPLPAVSAVVATAVELLAGAALVLGAAVPVAGLAAAFVMAGAIVFVNGASGIYAEEGGFAFPLAVGVAALLLAATGSGRFGVDHLLARPRPGHRRTASPAS
ncbi:DoxX family protein [Pseudonocardia sichuanensis]